MKTLTLLLTLVLASLLQAGAQTANLLLPKLATALEQGQDGYAVSLFRQSLKTDEADTEMFYWTHVDKRSPVARRLTRELVLHYRDAHNPDKTYLYARELLQTDPDNVEMLLTCAYAQLMRDHSEEACRLCEHVLRIDPDNLEANIFVGNFYYLQATQQFRQLKADYDHIEHPTRMQYADYRNRLSALFASDYTKARTCLLRAQHQVSSPEIGHTLAQIEQIEDEVNR